MEPEADIEDQELAELDEPVVPPRLAKILVVSLLLVWAVPGIIVLLSTKVSVVESGPFGDTFGVVNALFSAAAFAGIIYTILLQRRELKLQRIELRHTRKELSRSAAAQEKSERALAVQANSLLLAAQINGLTSRIEAYNVQVSDAHGVNKDLHKRLAGERHSLIAQLDGLILKANSLADSTQAHG